MKGKFNDLREICNKKRCQSCGGGSAMKCEGCGVRSRFNKPIGNKNVRWQCNRCWFVQVSYDLQCAHCSLLLDAPYDRFGIVREHCWNDRIWYCQQCWLRWSGPFPQCVEPVMIPPIQSKRYYDQECWRLLLCGIAKCLGGANARLH